MIKHRQKLSAVQGEITQDQKRELVRFAVAEMHPDEWERVRVEVSGRFTHEGKDRELEIMRLVLRGGESAIYLDRMRPELTHNRAKNLVYNLTERITGDDALMRGLARINGGLEAVPDVGREDVRWALRRMPQENRDYLISRIPPNPLLGEENRWRSRRITSRLFESDISDAALAQEFGMSEDQVKLETGDILTVLCQRPLVAQEVLNYREAVFHVPPMTVDEVRDKLRTLRRLEGGRKKMEAVIDDIPADTWRDRSVVAEHKDIAKAYFKQEWASVRAFVDGHQQEYRRKYGGQELKLRKAEQVLHRLVERIGNEPGLCDRIRVLTGESVKSAIAVPKPPPVEFPGDRVPREVAAAVHVERREIPQHLIALANSMVGDVSAFLRETGLPEDFFYGLDLERMRGVLTKHGIRVRSATACIATVLARQANEGTQPLTFDGLERALELFERNGVRVDEIMVDPRGAAAHIVRERRGRHPQNVLYLNPNRAAEVTDEALLACAQGLSPKPAPPPQLPPRPLQAAHAQPAAGVPPPVERMLSEVPLMATHPAGERMPEQPQLEKETVHVPVEGEESRLVEEPKPPAPLVAEKPATPPREEVPAPAVSQQPTGAEVSAVPPVEKPPAPAQPREEAPLPAQPEERLPSPAPPIKETLTSPQRKDEAEPHKPPLQELMEEAPLVPEFSFADFDRMVTQYGGRFKNRGVMLQDAGIPVRELQSLSGPYNAFRRFCESREEQQQTIREEGEKIIGGTCLLMKAPASETEEIQGHFQDALLGWMEKLERNEFTQNDLPRFALYRTLSPLVGLEADYSGFVDSLSDRVTAGAVPEKLLWDYAEIEGAYTNLAKALKPTK